MYDVRPNCELTMASLVGRALRGKSFVFPHRSVYSYSKSMRK